MAKILPETPRSCQDNAVEGVDFADWVAGGRGDGLCTGK